MKKGCGSKLIFTLKNAQFLYVVYFFFLLNVRFHLEFKSVYNPRCFLFNTWVNFNSWYKPWYTLYIYYSYDTFLLRNLVFYMLIFQHHYDDIILLNAMIYFVRIFNFWFAKFVFICYNSYKPHFSLRLSVIFKYIINCDSKLDIFYEKKLKQ